jgi:hypothetical protein
MANRSGLVDFFLTVTVMLLWLLLSKPGHALSARLLHDSANANATRAASSAALELEDASDSWSYTVFARRDDFAGDRTLTNAAALVSAGKRFGDHNFYLGLGAHFRQQKPSARPAEPADFMPALALAWHHSAFRTDISGSQKMTRAALAFLMNVGIPLELGSEFEYLESQPYRLSANLFAFVSRYGGLIAGYEPLAVRGRAGFWLKPLESLQLRSLMRFAPGRETYWEFSVAYAFDINHPEAPIAPAIQTETKPEVPKNKKPKTVPAFSTLVKWGLTPVEALRFAREKDICNLSAPAQAALKKHRWECHA